MKVVHKLRLVLLGAVIAASVVGAPAVAQQPQRPNVVFILADNVGYGDLGSYGGGELRGAPTPRLDQMAREGLRLTQYLVEPGCTPSRATSTALPPGGYRTSSTSRALIWWSMRPVPLHSWRCISPVARCSRGTATWRSPAASRSSFRSTPATSRWSGARLATGLLARL